MNLVHTLLERVLFLIPLWISLAVHEWAHARAAFALGDDTAQKLGRMTLDPLAHLDPIGTVVLPLLGIPFGWAKPVPVQPTRFRNSASMSGGMIWVAAAGPLSNALLASLLLVLDLAIAARVPDLATSRPLLSRVFDFALTANVAMAAFNLLPFPPLDGSRIVDGLVPFERRALWDRAARPVGLVCLALFLLFGGSWLTQAVSSARASVREIAGVGPLPLPR